MGIWHNHGTPAARDALRMDWQVDGGQMSVPWRARGLAGEQGVGVGVEVG